jgi:hypothetical protein
MATSDRPDGDIQEYLSVKRKFEIKVGRSRLVFEFKIDGETKEVQNIIIVQPMGDDKEVQPIEVLAILAIAKWAGFNMGELK